MDGSFNGQILVDKLVTLNNTQQSIETLSHWCIFHRNKAKLVVETWERQFYRVPRDQRICFLYLANDILQNSRRKGLEFINEFWKVLPGALVDVYKKGGELGKNTVLRLVDIWDERKVFGSRGQVLKDDILGRNKNEKGITYKLKQSDGALLEKIISGYNQTDGFPFNEDVLFGNCQASVNFIEKAKEQGNGWNSNESEALGEVQRHCGVLRECIEQLKAIDSSRTSLAACLREALHEQESKIEQVRQQLQFAQSGYQQSVKLYELLNISSSTPEQRESSSSLNVLPNLIPEPAAGTGSQTATVRYTQEAPSSDNNISVSADGNRNTTSATFAGKLPLSNSSQMFTYKPSSLSSDGIVAQTNQEDLPSHNKRKKLDGNAPSGLLPTQPQLQPPLRPFPPFLHPDFLNQPPPPQPPSPITHPRTSVEPPPPLPPSFPPTPPPPPPPVAPQFMPIVSGATVGMPFGYGPPPRYPNYPMLSLPPYPGALNPYHGFQAPEGVNHVGQVPLPTAPPQLTRQ